MTYWKPFIEENTITAYVKWISESKLGDYLWNKSLCEALLSFFSYGFEFIFHCVLYSSLISLCHSLCCHCAPHGCTCTLYKIWKCPWISGAAEGQKDKLGQLGVTLNVALLMDKACQNILTKAVLNLRCMNRRIWRHWGIPAAMSVSGLRIAAGCSVLLPTQICCCTSRWAVTTGGTTSQRLVWAGQG